MLIHWKEHQAVVNGLIQQLRLVERRCTNHRSHIDYLVKQHADERTKHRQELDEVAGQLVAAKEELRVTSDALTEARGGEPCPF